MVRNPTSCSSNLELGGIIPPSDPSPHWPSSRVASFSPAWPLVRRVPLGPSCGYHSWRVSAPALWVMGAEYFSILFLGPLDRKNPFNIPAEWLQLNLSTFYV